MRSDELIAKKLDGELSPAEAAELQELLAADPQLARELAELEGLEAVLDVQLERNSASARAFRADHKNRLQSTLMNDAPQRSTGVYWIGGGAALLLTLAAILWTTMDTVEQTGNSAVGDLLERPLDPSNDPTTFDAESANAPSQTQPAQKMPGEDKVQAGDISENAETGSQTDGHRPQDGNDPINNDPVGMSPDDQSSTVMSDGSDIQGAGKYRTVEGQEIAVNLQNQAGLGEARIEGGSSRTKALKAEARRISARIAVEKDVVRRAYLLRSRALIERTTSDAAAAHNSLLEALALIKEKSAPKLEVELLELLALSAQEQGDPKEAGEYKSRALKLCPPDSLQALQQRLELIGN